MSSPEHPLLPHLVDLESPYDPDVVLAYDPRELIRYAVESSDYWAERALKWLDQGAPGEGLDDALLTLEEQRARPQPLRHHARRLRKVL
ncbi:hypothetical protein ASE01_17325 [Nocardioides sp. Root190]|uniref:hypothetical protein n=1 Tax=Nocardioides sp. Root190 TaxID=1736488 RepID=UPI0006F22730|nr:hypothetical protein [Nocardioides sp. Root190]KRB75120.1 hypothetical protein ASE01_17325 [Nocardioides sp. Root190]